MKIHEPPKENVKPKGLRRNPEPTPLDLKARYRVTTYDSWKNGFTPQKGVRCGPYSLFGLRKALRKLRGMGYDTSREGGVSVFVERIEK